MLKFIEKVFHITHSYCEDAKKLENLDEYKEDGEKLNCFIKLLHIYPFYSKHLFNDNLILQLLYRQESYRSEKKANSY